MEKLSAILILCSIMVISVPAIHGIAQDPKSVEKWFENLTYSKLLEIRRPSCIHTICAWRPSNEVGEWIPVSSPSTFGGINVFDNAITVGPNITSKQLDRAQGLFVASSLGPQSLLIAMNPFFTE
ncbi:hypothetical protein CsSME_00029563 [Camellia sinensis var. sinensis]